MHFYIILLIKAMMAKTANWLVLIILLLKTISDFTFLCMQTFVSCLIAVPSANNIAARHSNDNIRCCIWRLSPVATARHQTSL